MSRKFAYLDITWWGVALNGEHYTARVIGRGEDNQYLSVELTHPLTQKEALSLNKKSGCRGYSLYSAGEETDKFWTEAQLVRHALKKYKLLIPCAEYLIKGSSSVCDPQEILDGPEPFKSAANKLWKELEDIGGYEGNEQRADEIFREYRELEKSFDLA